MGNYGSQNYGAGNYGGSGSTPSSSTSIPVIIELYDNNLGRKNTYQTGVGGFVGVTFTLDEKGPVDFTVIFSGPQSIIRGDIVKIKIMNSEDYFFTGVVREIPILGSSQPAFNYRGFGLNDYLFRVNTESQSYVSETMDTIVNDLVDTIITPKTPIKKVAGKINIPAITITSLNVNYAQIPDVLSQLQKIANSTGDLYHYGVDEEGDFFFKPIPTETLVTLSVGVQGKYGIPTYEPNDQYEAVSKLFVLDDSGSLVTTLSTTLDNDIFEKKVLAPQLGTPDIINWAEGILAEDEVPRRSANIIWEIEQEAPLRLLGFNSIRIISNIPPNNPTPPDPNPFGSGTFGSGLFGGGQIEWKNLDDTLLVKEVTYNLSGNESTRNIQLGALPVRLDSQINEIRKSQIELEINIGK
jgi:hypothetical protein